ncbi:hypothetical protein [Brevibacillus laterosporus]|uniref:hypothetical protein n=1 Tax=Brevibacillus laterosporus TaxID=1465 RepID=UPI0018CF5FF7|nr:hypothetical protein [Brevibacillus laterosporus]MBG9788706.1 hypothetical protein [Brevibacillus laterosporus]
MRTLNQMERTARIVYISEWLDEFIATHGKQPSPEELERLADAILYEELSDRHADKMTREEVPIMSVPQTKLRHNKEASLHTMSAVIGTDRANHGKPSRRKRRAYEMNFVDSRAKIRNRDRQRHYSAFKQGGYQYEGGELRYLEYKEVTYKSVAI